jgi:hypothetical protein
MPRIRRTLPAALAIAVLAAGCSSDEQEPAVAGFADATAISHEYEDMTSSLQLPEGKSWPSVSFDAESYSTGHGADRAYEYWRCAWARAVVAGDETGLDVLATYLESDSFADQEPASREIFAQAVNDAREGTITGMADYVELTCAI